MADEKIEPEDLAKELIIGFGFLEGLWIYAGMNPMTEIANALSALVPEGTSFFGWQFSLILFLATLFQIGLVYSYGGMWGILALILAYFGGIFIGTGYLGFALIFIAIPLGIWSFKTDKKVSFIDFIEFIYKIINYFKK